jgi:hypothetical protein
MIPPVVRTKAAAGVARISTFGAILLRGTPVSPAIPFKVMVWVLAAGGMIMTPLAAVGGVIVLTPLARFFNSSYRILCVLVNSMSSTTSGTLLPNWALEISKRVAVPTPVVPEGVMLYAVDIKLLC